MPVDVFLFSLFRKPADLTQSSIKCENLLLPARSAGPKQNLQAIAAGKIVLLNLSYELGAPLDWSVVSRPEIPMLWKFNLHYHEFLQIAVGPTATVDDRVLLWRLIADWITQFKEPTTHSAKLAWHPFCISRRLSVWATLLAVCPPKDSIEKKKILESMIQQTRWLLRHRETDIGGNHLWENGRALCTMGCFFEGLEAQRWRRVGLEILERCFKSQVSLEGEHFERSPYYQQDLIAGLQNLSGWLEESDPPARDRVLHISNRLKTFLDSIRHPDGGLPLFGDSILEPSASLIEGRNKSQWIKDYFVHSAGSDFLIFDAGNVGPDELPAHAHSDLLGFELSLNGNRCIVDSGVHSYSGYRRKLFRSSRAHNVLIVNGMELADVWSDFRMGRRGHVVSKRSGETSEGRWVSASHDAYKLFGVRVERFWFFAKDSHGPWFSIHLLTGSSAKNFEIAEYLHWHPDMRLERIGNQSLVHSRDKRFFWELAMTNANLKTGSSFYSPQFYTREKKTRFEIQIESGLPAISAWSISSGANPVSPQVKILSDNIEIRWMDRQVTKVAQIPFL